MDDAAEFVAKVGLGALLAKLDIKSVYKISPYTRGIAICLECDGRRTRWVIARRGGGRVEFIIQYLDNFLFGGSPSSESCASSLGFALQICSEVGFPIMKENVVGAMTLVDFLGFLIDTTVMEIQLPSEVHASWVEVEKKLQEVRASFHDQHLATCQYPREARLDLSKVHDQSAET